MPKSILRTLPTLPPLLNFFCFATTLLTLIGIITRFLAAHLFNLPQYPYGFYVTRADGLDLMTFYVRFQHFHSPDFFSVQWGPAYAYPAAVAPIYWLLFRVRHAQIPFVLIGATATIVLAWLFSRSLVRRGASVRDAHWFVLLTGLTSYPLYFEFTRGNMEIFIWFLVIGSVYAILLHRPWLGSVLLGFAIAMKLYPLVLLGLLFSRRQYLPIALAIAVAVAYSAISLWLVCPDLTFAQHAINEGISSFRTIFAVPYRPIFSGVDHSLYALIKRVLGLLPWARYNIILRVYTWVTALGGLLLYFVRIRLMPMINQVLCLVVAFILLPPVSFDYTLLHLYVPFSLLVMTLVRDYTSACTPPQRLFSCQVPVRSTGKISLGGTALKITVACFTILLAQIGEIILQGDRLGGQIKAVGLIVLFLTGLLCRFPSEWDLECFEEPRTATP